VAWLARGIDDRAVAREAARRGVVVEPLSPQLGVADRPPGLIMGYVPYEPAETRAAMRQLAKVVRSARRDETIRPSRSG
jgi:DNA-binding transcriptional MocR family regulator